MKKKQKKKLLVKFEVFELFKNMIFKLKKKNKNTLTGPANCKKTTRHHAQLCAKSRKTNAVKSRKWPKSSIWAVF